MTRRIFPVLLLLLIAACGTKKKITYAENRTVSVEASEEGESDTEVREEAGFIEDTGYDISPGKVEGIIDTALGFSGVRYKYGGNNENGIDCSGLLYVAFKAHDISLPRVSHEMAEEGKRVRVNEVAKGDLLFFTTTRRGRKINHVGLVVEVEGDDIKFIHSTTSRGVIVSSLREGFWNYAFVKATRVL